MSDISLFALELFGWRRRKWVSLKHPGEAEDGWRGTCVVRACICLCSCVMGGGGQKRGVRATQEDADCLLKHKVLTLEPFDLALKSPRSCFLSRPTRHTNMVTRAASTLGAIKHVYYLLWLKMFPFGLRLMIIFTAGFFYESFFV